MRESVFLVTKIDCPTEERLIRNRLQPIKGIDNLKFNLMGRELTVIHTLDDDREILTALESLSLGATRKSADSTNLEHETEDKPSATKWLMLASGKKRAGPSDRRASPSKLVPSSPQGNRQEASYTGPAPRPLAPAYGKVPVNLGYLRRPN